MEFFFLILLVVMLLVFGYAQLRKGVFKTPGRFTASEEEEIDLR